MARGTWYELAMRRIKETAETTDTDDVDELEKAIRAAYPFGERAHWPYKAWCRAVNDFMGERRKLAGKPKQGKEAPLDELPLFNVEIVGLMAVDYRNFDHAPCPVCGEIQHGGSHYHCPICEAVTSMYGHWDSKTRTYRCKDVITKEVVT